MFSPATLQSVQSLPMPCVDPLVSAR
jgi:hypothetical protein